jgi:hypothetical protein
LITIANPPDRALAASDVVVPELERLERLIVEIVAVAWWQVVCLCVMLELRRTVRRSLSNGSSAGARNLTSLALGAGELEEDLLATERAGVSSAWIVTASCGT